MRYTLPLLLITSLCALEVKGREGKPLYVVEVPDGWSVVETSPEKIKDNREPLISWQKGNLKARLHSFPFHGASIPSEAQVTRWLKKYPEEPLYEVLPVSQGGYGGLILVTEDFLGGAFSLGNRGKRAFRGHQELCSDWTFVVSGPREELMSDKFTLLEWVETIHLAFEIPDVD
jgi:hypothetical protein